MNLEEIDVVGLQSFQTVINSVEDGGSGQTALVYIVLGLLHHVAESHVLHGWFLSNRAEALGEKDQLVSRDVVLFDGLGCLDVSECRGHSSAASLRSRLPIMISDTPLE